MVGFVVQKQIKGHELQLMKVMANTMLMQQPFTSVGALHEATLLDRVYRRLVYEHMSSHPQALYGAGIKSNYQGQGLKLSKHFAPAKQD